MVLTNIENQPGSMVMTFSRGHCILLVIVELFEPDAKVNITETINIEVGIFFIPSISVTVHETVLLTMVKLLSKIIPR